MARRRIIPYEDGVQFNCKLPQAVIDWIKDQSHSKRIAQSQFIHEILIEYRNRRRVQVNPSNDVPDRHADVLERMREKSREYKSSGGTEAAIKEMEKR